MGRVVWIKPKYPARPIAHHQPDNPSPDPSASDTDAPVAEDLLAERRTKHMNRRIARIAELTTEALEAFDGRTFSFQTVAALARVFGTHLSRKGVWHYGAASDPWEDYDAFLNLGPEEAAAEIWTNQLEPVLASRLQYCGPGDAARLHREIVATLKLIGASYAELYRTVAKELPEPKAWAKLPGYLPEDLDGEPPAPAPIGLRSEAQDPPFAIEDVDLDDALSA